MSDLYIGGLSMAEVGERFGISRQRVDQLFKKFGIGTRKQTASKSFLDKFLRRTKNHKLSAERCFDRIICKSKNKDQRDNEKAEYKFLWAL